MIPCSADDTSDGGVRGTQARRGTDRRDDRVVTRHHRRCSPRRKTLPSPWRCDLCAEHVPWLWVQAFSTQMPPDWPREMSSLPNYLRYLSHVYWKYGRRPPRRYRYLLTTIRSNRCRSLLEIGVYNGIRALEMINASAIHHPRSAIRYIGFDLFEDMSEELLKWSKKPRTEAQIRQLLAPTAVTIELYRGFSRETLPRFLERQAGGGSPIDFVFIDGGHAVETIRTDWENVERLMTNETVVIFDDYYTDPPHAVSGVGCHAIVDALDRRRYDVEVLPLEDPFPNEWGTLRIRMASVKRRGPASGTPSGE